MGGNCIFSAFMLVALFDYVSRHRLASDKCLVLNGKLVLCMDRIMVLVSFI